MKWLAVEDQHQLWWSASLTYHLDNFQFLVIAGFISVDTDTQINLLWVKIVVRAFLQAEHGVPGTWLNVSKHGDLVGDFGREKKKKKKREKRERENKRKRKEKHKESVPERGGGGENYTYISKPVMSFGGWFPR